MINAKTVALAAALLLAAGASVSAAQVRNTVPLSAGVDQHNTVMNNINQAQQQNNAAINHVQSNIQSTQPKVH